MGKDFYQLDSIQQKHATLLLLTLLLTMWKLKRLTLTKIITQIFEIAVPGLVGLDLLAHIGIGLFQTWFFFLFTLGMKRQIPPLWQKGN